MPVIDVLADQLVPNYDDVFAQHVSAASQWCHGRPGARSIPAHTEPALTSDLRPVVPLPQPNPRAQQRRGGTHSPPPAQPRAYRRAVSRPGAAQREVRRRTPARRSAMRSTRPDRAGRTGLRPDPSGSPEGFKCVCAQRFVVDLSRLDRRPERPGAHRPRTRSTVRRCNRTPNRSATCSAICAPDPVSARMKSTISGRSLIGPRRPRRSSISPAIPDSSNAAATK